MSQQQPYGTVLIKADKILRFLAGVKQPQALHVIASETELTNSTVSKILTTLEAIHYVERNDAAKTYQLGSGVVRFANQYLTNHTIRRVASPFLMKLYERFDETVHLSMREGDEILYIDKMESTRPIVVTTSRIGFTKPMYASAMGKAILAILSEPELEGYLSRVPLTPITESTITNRADLDLELSEIRKTGIAIDNSEEQPEVFCIGATLQSKGEIKGAFSVSMPIYRRTEEREEEIRQAVLETKYAIERELSE